MIRCDENKPYIFISYAHRDGDRAYEIINGLENAGYNVWYDGGIDPGTEWDQNIANHVKGCVYFIAFVSEAYIGSENCKDELNYARDLDKDRLLVYLEDVQLPDGMAMRMNRIQAIFWNKYSDVNEAYNKLFSAQGIERAKLSEDTDVSGAVHYEQATVQKTYTPPVKQERVKQNEQIEKMKKKLPKWAWILIGVLGVSLIAGIVALSVDKQEVEENKNYEGHSLTWYLTEAEDGDKTAMLYLADYYYNGLNGTEKNYAEAVRWYKEAAKKKENAGKAYAYIGMCYSDGGDNLEKDDAEAMEWFEKAIDEGVTQVDNIDVYYELGYMHYRSSSTLKLNRAKAVEYFDKAIENGNTNAYFWKGDCYYLGDDTLDADYAKTVECMTKAIEAETTDEYERGHAWEILGDCYYEGDYGVEKDYAKALECYKESEALGTEEFEKSAFAMGRYAVCYYEVEDYESAAEWFKKAESVGELTEGYALYVYGWCNCNGYGVDKDYDKAFSYLKKAYEKDCVEAAYGLGLCYYCGFGVEQDYNKAFPYFKKAADNGIEEAYNNVGFCYYNGYGVYKDYNQAFSYFNQASESGDSVGTCNVGICYEYGYGVEQDLEKAKEYYQKAADMGYEKAKTSLERLQAAE